MLRMLLYKSNILQSLVTSERNWLLSYTNSNYGTGWQNVLAECAFWIFQQKTSTIPSIQSNFKNKLSTPCYL